MNMLQHKGYYGSIEASVDDNCFFGKLEFISDLVNFEGETLEQLNNSFIDAAEDYILTCAKIGKEPEKPCKGSFNIRIGHDLHLAAYLRAKEINVSLNEYVRKTIAKAVGL